MINALIIDDEKDCRVSLIHDLKTYCPQIKVIGEAEGVKQGIELINKLNPDLIFLDIQMNDGTGFDLLETLKTNNTESKPFSFHIIFTTAYDQFAIKAFKYSAIDYLLKPILSEELIAAVEKLKYNYLHNELLDSLTVLLENKKRGTNSFSKIILNVGECVEIHRVEDIIRCESEGNYTNFYFKDKKKLMVSRTLKEFDEMLSSQGFFRIHQSHLINVNYLVKYNKSDGGYAVMSDGSQAPISRNKKEEFVKLLASL